MAVINPHLNFNGNAEEAFRFYQSVFGGAVVNIMRFKDMANEDNLVPESEANKIMHIALPIGNNRLIGNDVPASMGQVNENENRSKIAISAASREEATVLFNGLSAGGNIEVPMCDSPWESYFGMLRDQFGIEWIIEFTEE